MALMWKGGAIGFVWLAVLGIGCWLRLQGLEGLPVHADEATGARIVAASMDGTGGGFDPAHFHGPTLPFLGRLAARIAGEETWRDLNIGTLRMIPALAGCLVLLLPLLLARFIGWAGSLFATALLATSPTLVYYNRIYIHESILLAVGLFCIPFLIRFLVAPSVRIGVLVGFGIGLMWATKITALIIWLSWALGGLAALASVRPICCKGDLLVWIRAAMRPLVMMAGATLATALFCFSDGFRHPAGFLDGFKTFFAYTVTEGHDKPFGYFTDFLFRPRMIGPYLDWDGWILLAIIPGLLLLLRSTLPASKLRDRKGRGLALFLLISFCIQFFVYSAIPYKTPWLMLFPVALLCLLGPVVWALLNLLNRRAAFVVATILATGVLLQIPTAYATSNRLAAHPSNPRAYVASRHSMESLPALVRDLLGDTGSGKIFVVGNHYWPLPWYLKNFPMTDYSATLDGTARSAAVVFCMPDQFANGDKLLRETHIPVPRGLRLDYPMVMHVRRDLWAIYTKQSPHD
jgi:uncharacterized protein (TIGR03663 family)